ncbi:MAG: hypothetical protein NW241_16790 [Bacteroidia bacterium]|nr:hypothetical protein [Bacteroidia bacterium]
MAQKNIADYSTEELLKSKKSITVVVAIYTGFLIVLAGVLIYTTTSGLETGVAVKIAPLVLAVTMLPAISRLGIINKELKVRAQA